MHVGLVSLDRLGQSCLYDECRMQKFIFIHRRRRLPAIRKYVIGGEVGRRRHPAITVDHPARMAASRVIVADPLSELADGPMKRQVVCSSSQPPPWPRRRSRSTESCCLSVEGGTRKSDGEVCDAHHALLSILI